VNQHLSKAKMQILDKLLAVKRKKSPAERL